MPSKAELQNDLASIAMKCTMKANNANMEDDPRGSLAPGNPSGWHSTQNSTVQSRSMQIL